MHRRDPQRKLPAVATGARILARQGLVRSLRLLGQAGGAIDALSRACP